MSTVTIIAASAVTASISGCGRIDIGARIVKRYDRTGEKIAKRVLRSQLGIVRIDRLLGGTGTVLDFFELVDRIDQAPEASR